MTGSRLEPHIEIHGDLFGGQSFRHQAEDVQFPGSEGKRLHRDSRRRCKSGGSVPVNRSQITCDTCHFWVPFHLVRLAGRIGNQPTSNPRTDKALTITRDLTRGKDEIVRGGTPPPRRRTMPALFQAERAALQQHFANHLGLGGAFPCLFAISGSNRSASRLASEAPSSSATTAE